MKDKKVGIIGVGNMGQAIIEGILSSNIILTDNLYFCESYDIKAEEVQKKYNLKRVDIKDILTTADIIIIAIKPADIDDLVKLMRDIDRNKIIISILAGVTIDYYHRSIGTDIKVVRVMPNLVAMISMGVNCISYSDNIALDDRTYIETIFSSIGSVYNIDEQYMNIVTALSGSAPAYIALIMESMIEIADKYGLDRSLATDIVADTLIGTANIIKCYNTDPKELISKVASPGGTTIEGLKVLNDNNIKDIIGRAIIATVDKAETLSK